VRRLPVPLRQNDASLYGLPWSLNDNDLDLGQRRNRLALLDLRDRLQRGHWTGPRHGQINYCAFPKYAHEENTFVGDETVSFAEFAQFQA
jgi:hypothetical protein